MRALSPKLLSSLTLPEISIFLPVDLSSGFSLSVLTFFICIPDSSSSTIGFWSLTWFSSCFLISFLSSISFAIQHSRTHCLKASYVNQQNPPSRHDVPHEFIIRRHFLPSSYPTINIACPIAFSSTCIELTT